MTEVTVIKENISNKKKKRNSKKLNPDLYHLNDLEIKIN